LAHFFAITGAFYYLCTVKRKAKVSQRTQKLKNSRTQKLIELTNEEYIRMHREEDVRRLALKRGPEGVNHKWCLQQIEGWQLACKKLPTWAATDGLWFPVRLSMEQCSGEQTAQYKRSVVERLIPQGERHAMADLTGGLGVDFSAMAPLFDEATYVEILPELRRLAEHNMPLLGIKNEQLRIKDEVDSDNFQFIYVDPARRDGVGRKTVGIADCTPNVLDMQDQLLTDGRWVMLKLSPMLDITEALRQLHHVREVHVVSVRGECKELLFVMHRDATASPAIYCVNLGTDEEVLKMGQGENEKMRHGENEKMGDAHSMMPHSLPVSFSHFLYEPNASILKAGIQDLLCERYAVRKLHPVSNLFVGDDFIAHFPGRRFRITGVSDFSKRGLKALIGDLSQANLTVRNFPVPVAQLRRQLRLSEGGDAYLFATTVDDSRHVLIRCQRV